MGDIFSNHMDERQLVHKNDNAEFNPNMPTKVIGNPHASRRLFQQMCETEYSNSYHMVLNRAMKSHLRSPNTRKKCLNAYLHNAQKVLLGGCV